MVPTRKEQKNATKTSTLRPEGEAKVTRTESARLPLGLTNAPNHGSLRHGWVDRTSSRRSVVRDLGCSFLCLCECVCVSAASPKRRDASDSTSSRSYGCPRQPGSLCVCLHPNCKSARLAALFGPCRAPSAAAARRTSHGCNFLLYERLERALQSSSRRKHCTLGRWLTS
eukprot:scaffold126469_cov90-Phaeocystis_antarctica.AAC.10